MRYYRVDSPDVPRGRNLPSGQGTETELGLIRRARRMNRILALEFPDAHCELDFSNPLELLIATVLSAQCTDKRVNAVTPVLFARYPNARAYAGASLTDLEEIIHSTGFYRNKAKSIQGIGRILTEQYDGKVPSSLDELLKLPGVGRKTANVVLGNAFGNPAVTVDTHVARMVKRWEWVTPDDPQRDNPEHLEKIINRLIPEKDWTVFSHRAIFHGRRVCHARRPACGVCALALDCPSFGTGATDPVQAAKLVRGPEKDHLLQMVGFDEKDIDSGAI